MMRRLAGGLALVAAGISWAQESAAPRSTLAVVPFASVTGEVPARTSEKAASMLFQELRSSEVFELIEVKNGWTPEPCNAALALARQSVEEAAGLRRKKKFRAAEEVLVKALTAYASAAPVVVDIGEVADAHALVSAVQYNTGRDEAGLISLRRALALAPRRDLPLAATSPTFARVVEATRKALLAEAKGSVLIESMPAHAPVSLDGVAVGATPLLVQEVPPGSHLWAVSLPTGEVVGGAVDVHAGKQASVRAAPAQAKSAAVRLLAALSVNRLDAELLAAAKEVAEAAKAERLLFGALSKEGKGLALDIFSFRGDTGELRRLPRAGIDSELLSAGMEFYQLVEALTAQRDQAGTKVELPSIVAAVGPKAPAEVKFGAAVEQALDEEVGEVSESAGGAPKAKEPKRRVPLKKK